MSRHLKPLSPLFLSIVMPVLGLVVLATPMTPQSWAQAGMPDLSVGIQRATGFEFVPGREITYRITYGNQGDAVASDVRIVSSLPGTTYVCGSPYGIGLLAVTSTAVIWYLDDLKFPREGEIFFTIRVDDDAPIDAVVDHRVTIICLDPELNYDNNEATLQEIVTSSITTQAVSAITLDSAQSGGDITAEAGLDVIVRGVCWSTSPNPTVLDAHTTDDFGPGSYTSILTALNPNTTYYVRGYAVYSVGGTCYGDQQSFTTAESAGGSNGGGSNGGGCFLSSAAYGAP